MSSVVGISLAPWFEGDSLCGSESGFEGIWDCSHVIYFVHSLNIETYVTYFAQREHDDYVDFLK